MLKKTFLILHGWNLNSGHFVPLIRELRSKGYKTYCPDLPGFGKTRLSKKSYFLSDYVSFAEEYISRNKLSNIVIIGHSFGGRIAIKLASNAQHKIFRLVLTGVPGINPVQQWKKYFFVILAKAGKGIFRLPLLTNFSQRFKKILYRLARANDYLNTDEAMKTTFNNIIKENLTGYLYKISVPVLLLWGKEDGVVPVSVAYAMQKIIPCSELKIINDSRHGVPWTHSKAFTREVLSFIGKQA